MTDAIQKAREALVAARDTLSAASRQLTDDHKIVLGGKRWGEVTSAKIDAALAALDAETEGWRTIDSAPKDGTEVIYLTSYGSRWIGNEPPGHARGIWTLVDGEWRGMSSSSNDVAWHSLPSPPESRS